MALLLGRSPSNRAGLCPILKVIGIASALFSLLIKRRDSRRKEKARPATTTSGQMRKMWMIAGPLRKGLDLLEISIHQERRSLSAHRLIFATTGH